MGVNRGAHGHQLPHHTDRLVLVLPRFPGKVQPCSHSDLPCWTLPGACGRAREARHCQVAASPSSLRRHIGLDNARWSKFVDGAGQDLCTLVASLQEEVQQLRREVLPLRADAGYWKSRHADALQRIDQLKTQLEQAHAEIRQLQQRLFGRKAECRLAGQKIAQMVDEDLQTPARKRGGQPGHAGHRRGSYGHLPAQEEFCELSEQARCCPQCGKPRQEMAATEDSQQLEIEVRAYRRVVRRKRYRATCDCAHRPLTVTAPAPPKLIPKGSYGTSLWMHLLLDKYSSARPTTRLIEQLRQEGITLSAATITEGFERLETMLEPVYTAMLAFNAQGSFHQADETRWMVYEPQEGKIGYRWWLWVILSPQCIVYLIDAHRSHDVPENHFLAEAHGVLVVDRYSAYKAMRQVKLGLLLLAFCWAHLRRDFLEVGRGNRELVPWTLDWLRRIRDVYRTNARRLEYVPDSNEFQQEDARLREQVAAMDHQAQAELAEEKLRLPCRKVLKSLQEHWQGLVRFVEDPAIPMDNNASERAGRGAAVGRKNYYGSGALWSARLAATMFSLVATLKLWGLSPQAWLTWYFEECAAAGGRAPSEIEPYLPWNLSPERIAALRPRSASVTPPNTS
jgi:transposase